MAHSGLRDLESISRIFKQQAALLALLHTNGLDRLPQLAEVTPVPGLNDQIIP